MPAAKDMIRTLNLEPLTIEGGFFRETYRSRTAASDGRSAGTCIYYLMKGKDVSRWHRLASSDEIWLYHAGSPAVQLLLFPDGSWAERVIGSDMMKGHEPQSVIPAGTWQAAVLLDRGDSSWGLFGAAVFPSFEYSDFADGNGAELALKYPDAAGRMKTLGLL